MQVMDILKSMFRQYDEISARYGAFEASNTSEKYFTILFLFGAQLFWLTGHLSSSHTNNNKRK